jgi:putative ABC transport system permease protein
VSWYLILEDQNLSPKNSAAYLAGFSSAEKDLQKAIPGARLNMPPVDPLENFVQRSKILAVLLMAFNLPAFAILLYFLLITSATVAAWQSKDTALLSSRGMSRGRIVRLALAEQGLLALVGCPLGLLFGAILARLMGYTASFLSFTGRAPLPVSSEGISLPLIALALGVYLLARLWPEMRQGKRSVLQTEREWARPLQKPLWYRGGFDLLLLLPSYYAYTQLLRHGTLAALAGDRPEELFRDPLVILLPGLFVMTLSFVMLRLFTIVLRGIDLLAGRIPWLALHLAFRQLGRQAHAVTSPLLLVVVSLAMGSYTLALAASLDRWEGERVHYQAGADLVILPQPLQEDTQVTDWNWIPAPADFKKVEGVLHAARVGEYAAEIELADQEIQARVLAIDRLDFPLVAWYRSDFSTEALGGLMNRLALAPNGVLVSRTFLSQTGLNIGDPLRVRVTIPLMETSQVTFSIAGFYDFFPTVYEEEEGVALIGNLEYLSTSFGFTLPHQLWLKLGLGVSGKAVAEALPEQLGFQGTILRDAGDSLAQEQARLERVGIYGTLTVGFLAGALMAVLGLLVYSYTSLRERVARFVILHALGVQNHQIAAQVFIEFTFLALFGSLAGMWIGSLVARLFIPFLGYTGGKDLPLPPLIPLIEAAPMRSLAILFTVVIVFMEVIVIRAAMLGKSVNRLE